MSTHVTQLGLRYAGSLQEVHGKVLGRGECLCPECRAGDFADARLELTVKADADGRVYRLEHVRPASVVVA